jgi:hypothetical protein
MRKNKAEHEEYIRKKRYGGREDIILYYVAPIVLSCMESSVQKLTSFAGFEDLTALTMKTVLPEYDTI